MSEGQPSHDRPLRIRMSSFPASFDEERKMLEFAIGTILDQAASSYAQRLTEGYRKNLRKKYNESDKTIHDLHTMALQVVSKDHLRQQLNNPSRLKYSSTFLSRFFFGDDEEEIKRSESQDNYTTPKSSTAHVRKSVKAKVIQPSVILTPNKLLPSNVSPIKKQASSVQTTETNNNSQTTTLQTQKNESEHQNNNPTNTTDPHEPEYDMFLQTPSRLNMTTTSTDINIPESFLATEQETTHISDIFRHLANLEDQLGQLREQNKHLRDQLTTVQDKAQEQDKRHQDKYEEISRKYQQLQQEQHQQQS